MIHVGASLCASAASDDLSLWKLSFLSLWSHHDVPEQATVILCGMMYTVSSRVTPYEATVRMEEMTPQLVELDRLLRVHQVCQCPNVDDVTCSQVQPHSL